MERLRILFAAALALWTLCSAAAAAPLTPGESAQIDALVTKALAVSRVPSASVAVVRDGRIVFAKAYGLRRLAPREPATVATRYRIASVSKQFTAAAVLMLVDEHRLALDDELVRYLPELGPANHATIRQALAQTAGFPEFLTIDYSPPWLRVATSPEAIVQRWGAAPPDFDPGSKWSYSNTGYVVLGRLVEKVSGQPLAALMQRRIFSPLGMTSAIDAEGATPADGDARGYMRAALGPPRETPLAAAGWAFGCGGLAMTASDLARWDLGLMDGTLLSHAAASALETEVKLNDGSPTGYGLGVFVDQVGTHRRIRHNGIIPGFWSENRLYPDDRAAVVVLVNGSYGDPPQEAIADGIEQMLIPTSAPPAQPPVTPGRIAGGLFRQLQSGTVDRSRLTPDLSDYLSAAVLADYRNTFRTLGDPLAVLPLEDVTEGGVRTVAWHWVWPQATLAVTLILQPDGKVSEFMAVPIRETGPSPTTRRVR
jgi:CubicO group peptidase (beta-lactamase class C family)